MHKFTLEGMTIRLDERVAALLEELGERFGTDDSATVAKALSLMNFICETIGEDSNSRLFVYDSHGERREIIRFGGEVMIVNTEGVPSRVI